MLVTSVSLRDFRNYERAETPIGDSLTVICGDNGSGKTNLIEGIYFGLTGRSCRTRNEREMVRHGATLTRSTVSARDGDGAHVFEVGFEPGEPKKTLVDGATPDASTATVRRPLVSVFVPERLELIKGAPSLRRAHVDQLVTALWPARTETRAAYNRALAQRNALIARIRQGSGSPGLLDPWDATLAAQGVALMADRHSAIDAISTAFQTRGVDLGLPEEARLRYRPRSRAEDADGLRAELEERRASDLQRGFTAHGPHRDEFVLEHGGRALRAYGSQGQQRAGVLALLLAERDALADAGRAPLMLLDDVMSELDAHRRERLAVAIAAGGQAIVTATEAEHVPAASFPGVTVLDVGAGAVKVRSRLEAA
ncbi:MAG: replication and repair protein RecF [Thermoleophilaceae bacterium]|nr:replication and repair protein RecF [Thermoleophilaceae bacterium]